MTKDDIKILEEHIVYKNFISVKHYQLQHKLFDGSWSTNLSRIITLRAPAVGAVLYDPQLDKVVLLEQFRVGALSSTTQSPWLIEIVAGLMHAGEQPEAVLKREVLEETGLNVIDFMPISQYWSSPGGSNETVFLYCAQVDATDADKICGLKEEHEDIRVFAVSSAEAFAMAKNGQINNAMALIGLLWLELNLAQVKLQWS